jgi:hypothetical protein
VFQRPVPAAEQIAGQRWFGLVNVALLGRRCEPWPESGPVAPMSDAYGRFSAAF